MNYNLSGIDQLIPMKMPLRVSNVKDLLMDIEGQL